MNNIPLNSYTVYLYMCYDKFVMFKTDINQGSGC